MGKPAANIKDESDVVYLLKQLLEGFTVTADGLEWMHTKSIGELACVDFERSLTPYLSAVKAADLEIVYRTKNAG